MRYYIGLVAFDSEPHLAHYGVKGMKWGVRRYQNADGTRTAEGKERYRQGKLSPMTPKDRYKARSSKLYKKYGTYENKIHDAANIEDAIDRDVAKLRKQK